MACQKRVQVIFRAQFRVPLSVYAWIWFRLGGEREAKLDRPYTFIGENDDFGAKFAVRNDGRFIYIEVLI